MGSEAPTGYCLPMGLGAKKNANYEELVALPEHLIGEIIDGAARVHRESANRQVPLGLSAVALPLGDLWSR